MERKAMAKKKNLRIEVILDRSGSMESIRDDTIGGFNTYLETLKKDKFAKNAKIRLTTFDSQGVDRFGPLKVAEMAPLTRETFVPRAGTPLYDAVGSVIADTPDEKVDATLAVIITDGLENSSREWSADKVKAKVKELTDKANWTFIYLGANQDAWAVGSGLGAGASATYGASPIGTKSAYEAASIGTERFALNGAAGLKVDLSEVQAMLNETVKK